MDLLLDNESQGSGVYLPELDEPEHCNAQNTALWELHLLQVSNWVIWEVKVSSK